MPLIELLIEKKRDPEQEYTLHLFEYCNLRCSFCWQNHENTKGLDTILEKLDPIEQFLKTETRDSVVFNAMGGEVFADEIFDETLLQTYKDLSLGVRDLAIKYNKKVKINWVTNLVTSKIEFIEDLMEYSKTISLHAELVTSYDPRGRFNSKQFKIFKHNLNYFGKRITCISVLLNSPNIDYFLKEQDEYFKMLYDDGYYIYFDYYMPDESADYQAPTAAQMRDAFRYLIDKYPNVHPIKEWLEQDNNYTSCRTSKLILADGTMCNCGNLVQDEKVIKFYSSKIEKMNNSTIEYSFLEKYNCISCEYLERCSFGCFMQHDYKFREELDECVYKITHRYIDDVRLRGKCISYQSKNSF